MKAVWSNYTLKKNQGVQWLLTKSLVQAVKNKKNSQISHLPRNFTNQKNTIYHCLYIIPARAPWRYSASGSFFHLAGCADIYFQPICSFLKRLCLTIWFLFSSPKSGNQFKNILLYCYFLFNCPIPMFEETRNGYEHGAMIVFCTVVKKPIFLSHPTVIDEFFNGARTHLALRDKCFRFPHNNAHKMFKGIDINMWA